MGRLSSVRVFVAGRRSCAQTRLFFADANEVKTMLGAQSESLRRSCRITGPTLTPRLVGIEHCGAGSPNPAVSEIDSLAGFGNPARQLNHVLRSSRVSWFPSAGVHAYRGNERPPAARR